jgi:SET domain-containing protein
MKQCIALFLLLCIIPIHANLVSTENLIDFIIEQKQNSDHYKKYPTSLIRQASWILGYGKIAKDDLSLLDRISGSREDIHKIIQSYPVNEELSKERFARWRKKKRSKIIKELREYTALQCQCSVKDAYGLMRDTRRISQEHYYAIERH